MIAREGRGFLLWLALSLQFQAHFAFGRGEMKERLTIIKLLQHERLPRERHEHERETVCQHRVTIQRAPEWLRHYRALLREEKVK